MTIHFLKYGMTACMEISMPPSTWPDDQKWSGDWDEVTCPGCLAGKELIHTFRIDQTPSGPTITCLRCRYTSHNPNDVAKRYCGACGVFHEDIWPPARKWWIESSSGADPSAATVTKAVLAADADSARQQLEWLWANCKIVYWPKSDVYPLEHYARATKDSREAIEAEMPFTKLL